MPALKLKRIAILGPAEQTAQFRQVIPEFPDLLASGDEPAPELALVCTPVATRAAHLERFLRAGSDVLTVHPVCSARREAARVMEIAEQLGRTLVTATPMKQFQGVLAACETIESGKIGRLETIEIQLSRKAQKTRTAHGRLGGAWRTLGADAIDLAEAVAGPIARIRATGETPDSVSQDEASFELAHVHGCVSRVRLNQSRALDAPLARCRGTAGEIVIGQAQSLLLGPGGYETLAPGYDAQEIFRALLASFLRERLRAEPAEDSGEQTLGWIEAGLLSQRSHAWEIA